MISTGWGTCSNCKKEYYIKHIKFPMKDIAHEIACPYCGITIGMVPKGTDDYNVIKKENVK